MEGELRSKGGFAKGRLADERWSDGKIDFAKDGLVASRRTYVTRIDEIRRDLLVLVIRCVFSSLPKADLPHPVAQHEELSYSPLGRHTVST